MQLVCKPLTIRSFAKYGFFASLIRPDGEKLAPGVVEFYRDLLPLPLGSVPTVSVTQIQPRPFVAEKWEYHTATGEAFMPIDGDVIVCLIPASKSQQPDITRAEAFVIPQGTMVTMRAGVWHQAPFACDGKTVHNLVLLPERTYANDCLVVQMTEEKLINISK